MYSIKFTIKVQLYPSPHNPFHNPFTSPIHFPSGYFYFGISVSKPFWDTKHRTQLNQENSPNIKIMR